VTVCREVNHFGI